MLFLQGSKDKLAREDLIHQVSKGIRRAKLIVYHDADHSFKVPKRSGISPEEMFAKLANDTAKWANK